MPVGKPRLFFPFYSYSILYQAFLWPVVGPVPHIPRHHLGVPDITVLDPTVESSFPPEFSLCRVLAEVWTVNQVLVEGAGSHPGASRDAGGHLHGVTGSLLGFPRHT